MSDTVFGWTKVEIFARIDGTDIPVETFAIQAGWTDLSLNSMFDDMRVHVLDESLNAAWKQLYPKIIEHVNKHFKPFQARRIFTDESSGI